mmetsp:Transcript_43689/g.91918  ORF Transcript_43689/g.91918 Transcript_43689/m.91918 type:complete len:192 (+) Transcript_43689:242-817(+)
MCAITKRDYSSFSTSSEATTTSASPVTKRRRPACDSSSSDASSSSFVSEQSSSSRKQRRSVSFAPNEEVRVVPRWTAEESIASWYSAIDVTLFKIQEGTDAALLRCLISNASCVEHLPQDASIYRGLERLLSPQIVVEIKNRRRATVKSVILEQERQKGCNEAMDAEKIAEVSRCCSNKAAAWAHSLGSLA